MKRTSRSFLLAVISAICMVVLSTSAGAAGAQSTGAANSASAPSALLPNTASVYGGSISISYPGGWTMGQPALNSWVLLNVPPNQPAPEPTVRVAIGYLERPDHSDAVRQLAGYANESSVPATFLMIGGWPALQRVQLVDRRMPGDGEEEPPPGWDPQMVEITTAVAADNLLVRIEGNLPSHADQALQNLVLAIGQSLVFSSTGDPALVQQELNQLKSLPKRPEVLPSTAVPPASSAPLLPNLLLAAPIFAPVTLNNGPWGELEVAVSNDGKNIVIAKQRNFATSNDGGQNFSPSQAIPVNDGDGSLAFGQSGTFYMSNLACFGSGCAVPCPGASPTGTPPSTSNCVEVAASTNNGQTFGALVNAAVCSDSGASPCALDQEHIAADPLNAAANSKDRVYTVIRDCQGGCGSTGAFITCSPDSNTNWAPLFRLEMNSDFPRITVGSDGFVYVVYEQGGNLRIDKFNACTTSASQMTRVANFPQTVTAFTAFVGCGVQNGFGGLDRCGPSGNTLNSPTVTVDDTNANHVYVAWAESNAAGTNDNIQVIDSTNGGVNWNATPVTVNTNATARRFQPWACATGGKAFVSWYDRRNAAGLNNDLTDYFAASAGLSGGNLVADNDEFKITTASDPECTFWPAAPRSLWDSENCGVQPQNAGVCKVPMPPPPPMPDPSTNTRCDFQGGDGVQCGLNPTTNVQEICRTGGGVPKYGDYNGNACGIGRLHTVFASGAGLATIQNFFQSFVVTPTPTTLTYSGPTTGDFDDVVTVSGTLTLSGTSSGVPGQPVIFSVGTQNCPAFTNPAGFASCPILLNQLNQPPGSYPITVSFAGSGNFKATSSSGGTFVITTEETMLTPLSQSIYIKGAPGGFSAQLQDDLPTANPVKGRTVNFTLTSNASAASQSCTPSTGTDTFGLANCTLPSITLPLGPATVTASFGGDSVYRSSTITQSVFINSPGLPNGWFDQDIGNPGVAGSASFNTGTFSVTGGGADIFDVPDQFHYVYQNGLTGDMSIKAHVASQTETDPLAKAGVMIRETTDPASTYVDVVVTPGDGVKMEVRSLTGGASSQIGRISGVDAPYWVLLVRTGNTFTGFASADNKRWTRLGTVNVAMAGNVNVGMAVTAHDNDDLSTATFDHVLLTTPVYRVNSGDAAVAPFSADQFFSGGATKTVTTSISLSGVPNPAPVAVYQSERFGVDATGADAPFTYTFPNLIPGFQYLVRLHFAEITFTSQDRRLFNVAINGAVVLPNFDIVAAAGAPNAANVQEFIATADNGGNITILYSHGTANHAKSSGIEIATIH